MLVEAAPEVFCETYVGKFSLLAFQNINKIHDDSFRHLFEATLIMIKSQSRSHAEARRRRGARERSRTSMGLPPLAPEASVSAIPPPEQIILLPRESTLYVPIVNVKPTIGARHQSCGRDAAQ